MLLQRRHEGLTLSLVSQAVARHGFDARLLDGMRHPTQMAANRRGGKLHVHVVRKLVRMASSVNVQLSLR